MVICKVTKVKPFDLNALFINGYGLSYDVQDMLLRQFNFPFKYDSEDFIFDFWDDRIDGIKWEKAFKKHFGSEGINTTWDNQPAEKIMGFLEEIAEHKLTGFRIVRYTNVSSGYPTLRFDVFEKSSKTPNQRTFSSNQNADNLILEERVRTNDYYYQ